MLTLMDMFCGAGGSSTGVAAAARFEADLLRFEAALDAAGVTQQSARDELRRLAGQLAQDEVHRVALVDGLAKMLRSRSAPATRYSLTAAAEPYVWPETVRRCAEAAQPGGPS